jgi:CHASE3 domain sensor protein
MTLDIKPVQHRLYWSTFFVVMALLAIFVRHHVIQLNHEVRREGLSSQVYIVTRSVLLDVVNIETGLRGYLIVGNPEYLRPYHEGIGRLEVDLSRLSGLTTGDRAETPHVEATSEAILHLLSEFSSQVEAVEERSVEVARERFVANPTKPTVDLVRDHLLAIQVEEVRKIDEATATLNGQMIATLWMLNLFVGVSVVLLIAMIIGIVASPTTSDS